jgi:predicted Zn finger-like uncharacterized protein
MLGNRGSDWTTERAMSSLIRCPACESALQVPEERLGSSVKCGRCEKIFTAVAADTRESEPYVRSEEPLPRREAERGRNRSRYDDDDDFDDRLYRIRRDDRYSRSEALARVSGPSTMLMIYGAFWILVAVTCALAAIWAASVLAAGANTNNGLSKSDAVPMLVLCSIGAVMGFVCGTLIFIGGFRMRKLRNWGLALTATILCFVVGGMGGAIGLLLMLIGLWPLIVLVDGKIKRAFQAEAEQQAP